MSALLAVVTFKHISGLVEDQVVNDFAFQSASAPSTNAERVTAENGIIDFYNGVSATTGSKVANILGTQLSRVANASSIKWYDVQADLAGTAHGSPIDERLWTLDAAQAGETNLPAEVSIVLSYHALLTDFQQELGVTRPAARRRGRIYLGPLNTLSRVIDGTTNRVGVSSTARTTIADAATRLLAIDPVWSQWSRANVSMDNVTGGFVDDAYDTQRRRGEKASTRTTWGGA